MKSTLRFAPFCLLILLSCSEGPKKVDFNTQIKPIINKKCISCHGGVKRNAEFSLLFPEDALDTAESGKQPIIPGDPDHSELVRRIQLSDPEERMPYKEEPLSKSEIDLLKQWIKEGAPWGKHWAYQPVSSPTIPNRSSFLSGFWPGSPSPQHVVDLFIDRKLEEQDLEANEEASPSVLLRRVSLDLTGVPPTPEEADLFLKDQSDQAYEKLVDRLLSSPRFGEKWATWWLDRARYADTKGYERDVYRNIWRYRDYVIRAFNDDMPFDRFTIEQLAGDLLPTPTDDQLIATAFHRNTMNNDEGGTEDEEFRVAAVIDRVNTTMEVWQSTTFGCVQCHSHPYDPFRHEEYYKLMAFFNNTRDEDTEGEHPNLRMYAEKDQARLSEIYKWITSNQAGKTKEVEKFLRLMEPKYHPHAFDQFVNGELIDTKWLGIRNGGSARLKNIDLTGKTFMLFNYRTGDTGGSFQVRKDHLQGEVIINVTLDSTRKRRIVAVPVSPTEGMHDLYFVFRNTRLSADRSVADIEWFAFQEDYFQHDPSVRKQYLDLLNTKTDLTPVMVENSAEQRRPTHVFERGNWLVHGQEVRPAVPEYLNPFPEGAPANRLGLAQWLMAPENPLTSRTVVNHVWEQFFGAGLVETLEDMGTQGSTPSHPELLDWLAYRLMTEHQWSLKKLMKDIVMSAAYRRDSRATQEQRERDPSNKWLSRGPSFRLSGEQLRDQALAVSGLLSDKMYGPSVMPYQPDGVWQTVYSDERWKTSEGEDRYRRAVYTFQKRTSPYPSMLTFDGTSREVCQVRRIRTNTPLQSLVTLNDPVYLEAAGALANRMLQSSGNLEDQIRAGYKMILFDDLDDAKLTVLAALYDESLQVYKNGKPDAKTSPESLAMRMVASALLNLDEVLNKQ